MVDNRVYEDKDNRVVNEDISRVTPSSVALGLVKQTFIRNKVKISTTIGIWVFGVLFALFFSGFGLYICSYILIYIYITMLYTDMLYYTVVIYMLCYTVIYIFVYKYIYVLYIYYIVYK
eukprot:GHVR01091134.1.p1 GENE.GHVR01091134.1~~GHVR01091134.1.p1  ORF type:complete len:119 (-),score=9.78 GHVR01091134.1:74-430(-)